jgi:hypothetical protein
MRQRAVRRASTLGVSCAAALIAVALSTTAADARSEKTLAYPRDQVWSTAVRFLVVDEHVKVIEKDADTGYVTFEIKDDGKVFRGSLEVMTVERDKRKNVRFVLQIEDRPDWIEIAMLTRLERKLRAELGSPAPAPAKDPPAKDDSPAKDDLPATDPPSKDSPKPGDGGPPISPTP